MRLKNLAYVLTVVLTASLALLLPTSAANADPAFPGGRPDTGGGTHTWCVINNPAVVLHETAYDSMLHMRDQTIVGRAYHDPCVPSTDVKWVWNPYLQGDAYGTAVCVAEHSDGKCDQFIVTLYRKIIDLAPYPDSQLRKTACHELGHTLGVSHYTGSNYPGSDTSHSCLRSGDVPTPNKSWHTTYGKHHVNSHINPWFS